MTSCENLHVAERAREAASFISRLLDQAGYGRPTWGVVLGSGLQDSDYIDKGSVAAEVEFARVPHMLVPTVPGHRGVLQFGLMGEARVLLQRGRLHYYETGDLRQVTFPLRVMKELGVERLILLNAAGALNPVYERGDLMLVRDHINLMGVNPLIGNAADAADRFVELASAYDEEMADVTLSIAQMERVRMAEGVLVGVAGPSYETGAELRFLRLIGGDAVSMSTVPEVIFARYLEMRILAISCITNVWDLRRPHPISHEEVLETARRQTPLLEKLVRAVIAEVEGSVQWRRA